MIDIVKIDDNGFGKGCVIFLEENVSLNVLVNIIIV